MNYEAFTRSLLSSFAIKVAGNDLISATFQHRSVYSKSYASMRLSRDCFDNLFFLQNEKPQEQNSTPPHPYTTNRLTSNDPHP